MPAKGNTCELSFAGALPFRGWGCGPGSGPRRQAPGKDAMDALTTLILAIPGTIIGIAEIRDFDYPLPR